MRIVAIAGSQIPSDTANSMQVMKACQALAQLEHHVTLIVPGEPNTSTDLNQHYGVQTDFHIEWFQSTSRRLFTWQAVQHARAFKPDCIYSWMVQSAVFGLLYKFPVVFEIHIQPTGLLGPIWHRVFAKLPGRKRLACITQALVDVLEHKQNIRFRSDEVVITPNGVDLERFASLPDLVTARRQTGLREAPTVMCTGHLYAGRGADLFLSLAKELPQAHFVWVGGRRDDIETWKQRAEAEGISNITFTGFVPNQDLPIYQAAADILLMPYGRSIMGSSGTADSASVASPMKMFEYMAAGRAILSADLPVIREVLNEKNAAFCEPDDVDAWERALRELLSDAPRRRAQGAQARMDVESYTWLARAERALGGFGQ